MPVEHGTNIEYRCKEETPHQSSKPPVDSLPRPEFLRAAYLGFVVEVVKRTPGQTGFQPVAKRWVVERTFGWLVRWRRLVRDYERRLDVSESMTQIAMASILLKRFIIDK